MLINKNFFQFKYFSSEVKIRLTASFYFLQKAVELIYWISREFACSDTKIATTKGVDYPKKQWFKICIATFHKSR